MPHIALVTVVVGDYDEAIDFYVRVAGARFTQAPRRELYGTVAVFEDLHGNRWDLIQPS